MGRIKVVVKKRGHDGFIAVNDLNQGVITLETLSGEAMYQLGEPEAVQLYLTPIISDVFEAGLNEGLHYGAEESDQLKSTQFLEQERVWLERIRSLEKQVEQLQKEKQELSDARDFLEGALSLGKDVSLKEDTPESKLLKRAYTALEEASASSKLKGWEEF